LVQELGGASIVEVVRDMKYGRTAIVGYQVIGGGGDPSALFGTLAAAEAELLRRTWNLPMRR
jgi:hypothetical protein